MKLNKKVVIPVVLIGTGIVLYFLNKAGKLDKLKNLIKGNKPDETIQPNPLVISPDSTITTSNPLGNSEAVKKFQKFYNRVKPIPFANLVVDGIFGALTQSAYNSYKDQYAKFLQVPSIFTSGLTESAKKKMYWEFDIVKWDETGNKLLEKHKMVVKRQKQTSAIEFVRKKYPLSKNYFIELNDSWSK